jgi:hypothetical protein
MGAYTYDLQQMFGLGQKPFTDLNVKDFCGADLGMTIVDFQTTFPAYYGVLNGLGWSDSEILGLTYFTACINEVGYMTQIPPFTYTGYSIRIPSGKFWYNSELRVGYATVSGDGPFFNYSQGGTELCMTHTNWKSVYGSGQDDTYLGFTSYAYPGEDGTATLPVALPGGFQWSHAFRIENLCMSGTTDPNAFNDSSFREAGIMYWWPGENSGVFNVRCENFNDFGLIISGAPAPARVRDFTAFHNKVGGIGIRGCAYSDIELSFSGDFNPWSIYVFRQGETLCSPNGVSFWPCFQDWNPGGTITFTSPKVEGWAAREDYVSDGSNPMSGAYAPEVIGKGQRFARLTGRFRLTVNGGTFYMARGLADALISVVDDFHNNGGTTPTDNSSVVINNAYVNGYVHWLHDWYGQKKWVLSNSFPTPTNISNSFYWRNGQTARDPNEGTTYTNITATYEGLQPFINEEQMIGPGTILSWNHNAAPTFNYNEVTGANY